MRRGLLRFGRVRARRRSSPVCRVGLPTAVTGVMFSLIYVFLTRTTTRFGTPALAALGIGHRVESWLFMIGVGFGAATAAIVGQNLGAGRADRAARAGWMATAFCTALGVVACVLELRLRARSSRRCSRATPAVIAEAAQLPSHCRDLAARRLRGDRARGRARRSGGDRSADAHVHRAHGVAHPARRWAATRWGSVGHLVGHLAHRDGARDRDGGALARRPLEAQISCSHAPSSSRCSPTSARPTATSAR